MSSNEKEQKNEKTEGPDASSSKDAKTQFGSLTPLTAAQIVTLLIGTGMSNTSSGGGY